jgi:hypothetical protein
MDDTDRGGSFTTGGTDDGSLGDIAGGGVATGIADRESNSETTIDVGEVFYSDGASAPGSDPGEPAPRSGRRKGKRNSGGQERTASKSQTSKDLAGLAFMAHMALSKLLAIPELVISQDEAEQLTKASMRVAELYGGVVLPETVVAWSEMIMATVTIYGPRYGAYKINERKRRAEKAKKDGPPVIEAIPINFSGGSQGRA